MSRRRFASFRHTAIVIFCLGASLLACDDSALPEDHQGLYIEAEAGPLAVANLQASDVPWPAIDTSHASQFLAQPPIQQFGNWTIETFVFSSDPDFLAISTAPDVLFAPFPEGISPLPPEISNGFLLAFQFRDTQDNVIGIGSELEVLDFETLTGHTAYSLMINDRGSISVTQDEDFAWLFDLVDDMALDQVTERTFNPPVVALATIPGSARVIGGSGEFAGVHGFAREYGIVYGINLVTREPNVATVLQVAYH